MSRYVSIIFSPESNLFAHKFVNKSHSSYEDSYCIEKERVLDI